ncbi:46280_t:CDS:10 [Gigaspora margarita]|uniref:46280_t:CDS:1 n=1 Tax=Gigaspora margarita TaxID=4874 RepID=A0ABN7UWS5_GIGMA|nr:46280_t:CDS:10 [Gigaspora margarita]
MNSEKEICKYGVIVGEIYSKKRRVNKSNNQDKKLQYKEPNQYEDLEQYENLDQFENLDQYKDLEQYENSTQYKDLEQYDELKNYKEFKEFLDQYKKLNRYNLIIDIEGEYIEEMQCPICFAARFQEEKVLFKTAAYYPLIPRLRLQYANLERSKSLRYHSNYILNPNKYCDIFDGQLYKQLLENDFIKDERDLILTASLDGYQIFQQQRDDNWVIMFINNNIPLEDRVKRENLLIAAIIPGPNCPKNFNSFMRPIIDELKKLEDGIICWDGWKQERFILRAFVPIWCGNIPANSKLMCVTGHNGYMGCRFCDLEGVSDSNILFELKAIQFPTSFPLDIMHLIFEGDAMYMYKHWSGTFYSDKSLNNSETNPQTLSKTIWKNNGYIMEANKKSMPSEFGRPPLNIVQHSNAYKAEDWIALKIVDHVGYIGNIQLSDYVKCYNYDRFYHLRFVSTLYTQISPPQLSKQFQSRQVVWIKDGEEELWAPSLDYTLNHKEFIALSNFYYANLEEPILELNDWGVKYAKFRTREGYMIGSLMLTVAANACDNSCVLYELEVNIAKPREAKKYELQQFFEKYQLLAYIHNARNARKGLYGIYSFEEFGDYEFVDVSMVQKCVGFMKVGKCFYIIDKSN